MTSRLGDADDELERADLQQQPRAIEQAEDYKNKYYGRANAAGDCNDQQRYRDREYQDAGSQVSRIDTQDRAQLNRRLYCAHHIFIILSTGEQRGR
jgi:hypothetical protein